MTIILWLLAILFQGLFALLRFLFWDLFGAEVLRAVFGTVISLVKHLCRRLPHPTETRPRHPPA